MKVRTLLACAGMLVALVAAGIAGCGDDEGASKTAAKPPKGWVADKVPEGLGDIADRLKDAGYATSAPKGRDATLLRVSMEAGGSAYVLVKTKELTAKQITETNKSSRGRLHAELVGSEVYVASSGQDLLNGKKRLTDAQMDEFEEIVSTGSGGT